MNISLWQIAAGLGVGAFVTLIFFAVIRRFGASRGAGFETSKLSREATFVVAVLVLLGFAGITIVALVVYAPVASGSEIDSARQPARNIDPQLARLLGDRYTALRKKLDDLQPESQDQSIRLTSFKAEVFECVRTLEDALRNDDSIRLHEATKSLLKLLESEEADYLLDDVTQTVIFESCNPFGFEGGYQSPLEYIGR